MKHRDSSSDQSREAPTVRRLLAFGTVAAAVCVVVNGAIALVATAALQIPSEFQPLHLAAVTIFTLGGVALAVLVFGFIAHLTAEALRVYLMIVTVGLVLSWLPDLLIYRSPVFPGTTGRGVLTLAVLHLTTALLTVGVLRELLPGGRAKSVAIDGRRTGIRA